MFISPKTPFHLVRVLSRQDVEGGLAVFVNKINNLATQSWKKILAFAL
jgi:hypothetical protein